MSDERTEGVPNPQGNEPNPSPESDTTQTQEGVPTSEQESTGGNSTAESSLPEGVAERTKAEFEKLTESNRRLKEQLEAQKTSKNPFDMINPKFDTPQTPTVDAKQFENLSQGQVDNIASDFVDEDGNVDIKALNQTLANANQRSARAEEQVRRLSQDFNARDEARQLQEAYKEFPELNPSSENHDPTFYRLVENELVREFSEGRQVDLLSAAKSIRQGIAPKAKPDTDARQQGPIAEGRGAAPQTDSSIEDLRVRTQQGDESAIVERLRKLTG